MLTQRLEVVKGGVLPLGLARVERPQTKHFGARGAINHAVLDRQRPCRLSGCRWKRVDDAERPRVSDDLRRLQHEHRPAIYASAVIIGGAVDIAVIIGDQAADRIVTILAAFKGIERGETRACLRRHLGRTVRRDDGACTCQCHCRQSNANRKE